jgi:hypothetical protein
MCELCKKDYCPKCKETLVATVKVSDIDSYMDVYKKEMVYCKDCAKNREEFIKNIGLEISGKPIGEAEFILGPDN